MRKPTTPGHRHRDGGVRKCLLLCSEKGEKWNIPSTASINNYICKESIENYQP